LSLLVKSFKLKDIKKSKIGKEKKKTKVKMKKLDPNKMVISYPTNFRHQSHISQVQDGTFQVRAKTQQHTLSR
jgi:hypothetical protein